MIWIGGSFSARPFCSLRHQLFFQGGTKIVHATQETTKRIFLSDTHMGDERSINPGGTYKRYCWFYNERPRLLGAFLKHCIDDGSVSEVVILGDLFDEWICPTRFDPTDPAHPMPPPYQQFINIANAQHNKPVVEGLGELAAKHRLRYLPGNHDMLANKIAMEYIFPDIAYVDPAGDGHTIYQTADGIRAEHGHWYGLFNAAYRTGPRTPFSGSTLPLGFFVSRITADQALTARKSPSLTPADVYKGWIGQFNKRGKILEQQMDDLLSQLFSDFVSHSAADKKGVLLNGLDGLQGVVNWKDVKEHYRHIYSEWQNSHADNVDADSALQCDAEDLLPAVRFVFQNHKEARILICGHTHKHECTITLGPMPTPPPNEPPRPPDTGHIYANTGAWINARPHCTFVETEFDPVSRNHAVRLRKWTQSHGRYVIQRVPGYQDWSVLIP